MWVKRKVPRTGIEPARPIDHYPLKVARLPVPPPGPINIPLKWIPDTIYRDCKYSQILYYANAVARFLRNGTICRGK